MALTYQELFPELESFSHLTTTVEQYFSGKTPLWLIEYKQDQNSFPESIACVWVGNSIDQLKGDRYAHIFLLYVKPSHRQQGIGTMLMTQVHHWAMTRGDRQIGLMVFAHNQTALRLYNRLGYTTDSLLMVKPLTNS